MLYGGPALLGTPRLSLQELPELSPGTDGLSVEDVDSPCSNHYGSGFNGGAQADGTSEDGETPPSKKQRGKTYVPKKSKELIYENFIKKHLTTPLSSICKSVQWLAENDLRYINNSDKKFVNVLNTLSKELLHYSIRQFHGIVTEQRFNSSSSSGKSACKIGDEGLPQALTTRWVTERALDMIDNNILVVELSANRPSIVFNWFIKSPTYLGSTLYFDIKLLKVLILISSYFCSIKPLKIRN